MSRTLPVSRSTQDWLEWWLTAGARVPPLTQQIINELKLYRPATTIELYRAEVIIPMVKSGLVVYNDPSSWTYEHEVATWFADDRNAPIIKTVILPENVLVDTTLLPSTFMRPFNGEEAEVILLPGTYEVTVVEN